MPLHTDRQRLADALTARRAELRITQTVVAERAGVSLATINLMERQGRANYQTVTKAVVEQAVEWAPGSIDALLAGGDATPLNPPDQQAPGVDAVAKLGDGQVAVLQAKRSLEDLLDEMPRPTRLLWQRLAYRIADELLIATSESAGGNKTLTVETESGRTVLAGVDPGQLSDVQVEQAAEQMRAALATLEGQTRRSVQ